MAPFGGVEALQQALSSVGLCNHFSDDELHDLHGRLAEVIGRWTAEKGRLEVAPIARNLVSMGRSLLDTANTLQSIEAGFQQRDLFETTQQLIEYLSLEPSIGSREKAEVLVASFRSEAVRIGHASLIAAAGLASEPGKRGRTTHDWYDSFTALLLDIAACAQVRPTLGRNGKTEEWTGWLIQAAQSFEALLPPHMRSPSIEACGRRLVRSRSRLKRQREHK